MLMAVCVNQHSLLAGVTNNIIHLVTESSNGSRTEMKWEDHTR